MARKPRASKASKAKKATGFDPITDAMLAEAAALGWRAMTLAGIAERAGAGLGDLLVEAPSKAHLAVRFIAQVDRATVGSAGAPDLTQSPRDRLFEVLMRRFDALSRNKDGARAVLKGLRGDPGSALASLLRMDRACAAMLAAAGLSPDGLCGLALIQGLKGIYLAALRAWMRDDSDDMANTMAALDRALRGAERLMSFNPLRRRKGGEQAQES